MRIKISRHDAREHAAHPRVVEHLAHQPSLMRFPGDPHHDPTRDSGCDLERQRFTDTARSAARTFARDGAVD